MKSLLSKPLTWLLATVACGIIYVADFAWSPSSYGLVLQQIGVANGGPDIGRARPIRSDEWSVVTPLTQVAVRNGFDRINRTSIYEEDLRINYGIPLADWGVLFKPTLWGFFVLDPGYAYSLHWYLVMALFLGGHALLFKRVGIAPATAGLLSVALYFTGFTQFWWNEKGPIFALFPWVVLTLLSQRLPLLSQLALFYWLSASWLITNLYPPVQVSLVFVGMLLVLGWQPAWREPRRLALVLITAAASAGTVALYLKDYLLATAATVYPGNRSAGGGAVPWQDALSYVFPFSTFHGGFESVIGNNICEVGTGATALTLLVACFLDYQSIARAWHRADKPDRLQMMLLGAGMLAMAAWMLIPFPPWIGYPLLWNHAPGERMEYAFGLLLALTLALLAQQVGVAWSMRRLGLYVGLVLAGWAALKLPVAKGVPALNDLVVLLAVAPAIWAWRRLHVNGSVALVGTAALAGLIALWGFNPLQDARPLFAHHDTALIRELARQQNANGGVLAYEGLFGAVQNGLGFRAVSHVTAVPALEFWRKQFPDATDREFMDVFNRYSHIVLEDVQTPRVLFPDRIAVPIAKFKPNELVLPHQSPELQTRTAAPVWLFPGAHAHGHLTLQHAGRLLGVKPLIGNGNGTSDGRLVVRLCRSGECLEAARDLRESKDNAYFELPFPRGVELRTSETWDISLRLEGARNPMALWAYPSEYRNSDTFEDVLTMSMEGDSSRRWAPRLNLRFEQRATTR